MSKNISDPIKSLKRKISSIKANKNLKIADKIKRLNQIHSEITQQNNQFSDLGLVNLIENAIEDIFGFELRRLNAIREANLEQVDLNDIEQLKDGFAQLFGLIDSTLFWNYEKKAILEGVINRASLRAMLIDPAVSIKTKDEIIRNWEDYM